ncbi:MAG: tetratricopeptide repeat protein [Methanobrevibacter sp.]|jgi:tetratricopeptide (TPR) repeat protein|nr:tetratricopeptide repeat protein [Candidatus Methanoflexus mossambicus]
MSKITKEKLERKLNKAIKNGNHVKLIKIANQLSKLDPNDFEWEFIKGRSYIELGKYADAVKAYKNAINRDPTNKEIYREATYELEFAGLFDEALKMIEEGLKINPDSFKLIEVKTMLFYDNDHEDDAYEYIDSFSQDYENYDDLLLLKSQMKEMEEKYQDAMEIYDEILKNGKNSKALLSKTRLMKRLGLDDDEIYGFLESFYNNENLKDVAIMLTANTYSDNGEGEKAISFLDNIYGNDLENPKYKLEKGILLLDLDKPDDAEKYLLEYFKSEEMENEDTPNTFLAMVYSEKGYFDKAIEFIDAIDKDSEEYEVAEKIKETILDKKERKNKEFLEELSSFDSDNLNFDNDLNLEDNFNNANIMPFEKMMYEDSDNEAFILINQAREENNSKKRVKLAKEAIAIDKYAIDAYNILAEESNNDDETLNYLKTAIDMFYESNDNEYLKEIKGHFYGVVETRPFMRAMQYYGELLDTLGREEEAMEVFELMLELNPGDNQGIRYNLINSLLYFNKLDELMALIEEYDEESTQFLFSKLLWAIKSKKDKEIIENYYVNARNENPHVAPLLLNKIKYPKNFPTYYSPGDINEGVIYIAESNKNWNSNKMYLKTLERLYNKFK